MKLDKQKYLNLPPESYWIASSRELAAEYPALKEDVKADVVIVGGGITGITCAYLLKKEGFSVILLEAGMLAGGTTGHTTAKITSQHHLIYDKLIKQFGIERAQQYATANETAIREIKAVIDELGISCDYVPQPAIIYTEIDEKVAQLQEEMKAAERLGLPAFYQDAIPLPFTVKGALRFDQQAQFHPLKYSLAVAKAFVRNGGHIFEKSRAVEIEKDSAYTVIMENGCKAEANQLIIASHYPFYNKHEMYFARIYQERSYVTAIKASEQYPGGMYINVEDPVRSLRSQKADSGELILVGGARHKSGQCDDTLKKYEELLDFASPYFSISDVPFHWSAQDCMTMSSLPLSGNYASDTPNLYIATGFGKWGMTNSMASAMLIKDLITKGDSPWKEAYNPSKKASASSAFHCVTENLNTAEKLIGGKLSSPPKEEEIDIAPGEGRVVTLYGKRAGAYRDEAGVLYIVNTTCTHMGCELNWNNAEKTWDCPCHGSRFSFEGKIIEGPAVEPLSMEHDVHTIEKLLTEEF